MINLSSMHVALSSNVSKAPAPLRPDIRAEWLLRDDVAFLNHGSFGAAPRVVLEEQQEWRRRVEAEPVEVLGRQCGKLLEGARREIGRFLGMRPEDFGFVTNATEGVNSVLRSVQIQPGDELLTTDHVYNAIRQAMKYMARRSGATYREVEIPLPVRSGEQILERIVDALSAKTRLLVIDHVTSSTALVLPVERITQAAAERGIDVIIDGAHAPGMLPLDVDKIGAAYYAGNLHKWVCAPKGSAFLWARRDRQKDLHPSTISHFLDQGFGPEFGWQGTRDITAWLATPRAIRFIEELGFDALRRHNHEMATWAHAKLCARWGVAAVTEMDGALLGSMATMRMPGRLPEMDEKQEVTTQQRLYSEFGVEAPIFRWCGRCYVRVSAQAYNRPEEYERLGAAIETMSRSR